MTSLFARVKLRLRAGRFRKNDLQRVFVSRFRCPGCLLDLTVGRALDRSPACDRCGEMTVAVNVGS